MQGAVFGGAAFFGGDEHIQIGHGQQAARLLRPLGQLQRGRGKGVAQARVFPLGGVAEAVEVKVKSKGGMKSNL